MFVLYGRISKNGLLATYYVDHWWQKEGVFKYFPCEAFPREGAGKESYFLTNSVSVST